MRLELDFAMVAVTKHELKSYFAEPCPYAREKDIAHYLSGLEAAVR